VIDGVEIETAKILQHIEIYNIEITIATSCCCRLHAAKYISSSFFVSIVGNYQRNWRVARPCTIHLESSIQF
jgi:hypothetical protein